MPPKDSVLSKPGSKTDYYDIIGLSRWLQVRYDFESTVLRPFDDLRYDRAAALRPK